MCRICRRRREEIVIPIGIEDLVVCVCGDEARPTFDHASIGGTSIAPILCQSVVSATTG